MDYSFRIWWSWGDSNPLPFDCQSNALPIELQPRGFKANLAQIEVKNNPEQRLTSLSPQLQTAMPGDHAERYQDGQAVS